MDEEFDTSVDTSDVDTSADMDTLDVVDDVPDDIPDDIPEDVPEDESELTGEDDLSEDIPEDVPEDEPELTEEDDLSEDIPEDVPEDEPELTEENDLSDDIPEDVPKDELELTGEDDLSEDIPEDVPEDEPELTEENDLSDDIPEDVPEDEPELTEEDDLSEDIPEDVPDDEPEPIENDFTEDIPEDVSDDKPESMKDDLQDAFEEQDEDASDNDDSTTDEVSEETTSETEDTDAAEQISDTQDKPLDDTATDEVSEETTSETEDTDAAEQISDTQDESMDDAATSEDAEDATSDVDNGDSTEPIEDTQDVPMDDSAADETTEDTASDVDNDDTDESIKSTQDESVSDAVSEKMTDDEVLSNDTADAMSGLSDYMNKHNYGPNDFDTYSQDSEWRELQQIAFPDYELPPLDDQTFSQEVNLGAEAKDTPSVANELLDIMPDASDINGSPERDIANAMQYNKERFGTDSPQYQSLANRSLDPLRDSLTDKQREYDDYAKKVAQWTDEMNLQRDPSNPDLQMRMDNTQAELNANLATLRNEVDAANTALHEKMEEVGLRHDVPETTFVGLGGQKSFADAYDGIITSRQDGGTCGINFAASAENQQTGSMISQKDAVQEFLNAGLCDDGETTGDINDVGGTNALNRERYFAQRGLSCDTVFAKNLTLEDMAARLESGESIGLSVHAQDLDSNGLIDEISRRPQLVTNPDGTIDVEPGNDYSNHMTTVAGFDRAEDGTITTMYLNDTGRWNKLPDGMNVNRIPIPAAKFYAMRQQTTGMHAQFIKKI